MPIISPMYLQPLTWSLLNFEEVVANFGQYDYSLFYWELSEKYLLNENLLSGDS